MRVGVFPGCFDPLEQRHLDAIVRARGLVDRLIIGVSATRYGAAVSPMAGRVAALRLALDAIGLGEIEVEGFEDLMAAFADRSRADVVIRRAVTRSDFQRVRQEADLSRELFPQIETVILGPGDDRGLAVNE